MRVAFCIRSDWQTRHGGDVVQLLKTKEALERHFGLKGGIVDTPDPAALAQFDLVHIFNVQEPQVGLAFSTAAKSAGKKYVLSTVFWDLSHSDMVGVFARFGRHIPSEAWLSRKPAYDLLARFLGRAVGKPQYYSKAFKGMVADIVRDASMLLPNSIEEADQVRRFLGTEVPESQVVVNAVDPDTFAPLMGVSRDPLRVAMVGRVEPIKNQAGMLSALQNRKDLTIDIVGKATQSEYLKTVSSLASSHGGTKVNTDGLDQAALAELYSRSQVHVLPSFRESPGLATLEALHCGCRVVVAEAAFCPVGTYFEPLLDTWVFTCNPYSSKSMLSAVEKALNSNGGPDPTEWLAQFTWEAAARQTHSAYKRVAEL